MAQNAGDSAQITVNHLTTINPLPISESVGCLRVDGVEPWEQHTEPHPAVRAVTATKSGGTPVLVAPNQNITAAASGLSIRGSARGAYIYTPRVKIQVGMGNSTLGAWLSMQMQIVRPLVPPVTGVLGSTYVVPTNAQSLTTEAATVNMTNLAG